MTVDSRVINQNYHTLKVQNDKKGIFFIGIKKQHKRLDISRKQILIKVKCDKKVTSFCTFQT